MAANANPFLLAADNSPALLPLLRDNPSLASGQDEHGYSLVHAAASYNHLDLLRALIREFHVDVNLRDEDNETALFVVETVDAAKVLVEELRIDISAKNTENVTARQKITEEDEFPQVAEYLTIVEAIRANELRNGEVINGTVNEESTPLPPAPHGMTVTMGTMAPGEADGAEVDPEFRQRIEQLAQRDDFHTEAGQAELRALVQDAIGDANLADRNVRPRQD
ncbi:ankyrin repeat-containing protein [Pseudomassariella vexata]|uniref:Ankyrin repeat-containing protein n=1 Tax=Pseudomassariella vexata TaxID=1141098 RepID=A0A1Y2DUP6_9PEZI|nr:ankyrin repeat-containing protein [Pseudomassariella vexata]ORY62375.1 ankyrin repeat-containing protein [Pseudomassariella vexata]